MRIFVTLLLLAIGASASADDAKPNRIERGVNKVGKGVERTVDRTEKGVKRAAKATERGVTRTVDRTEKKVKKILE
ncbi:MAG TPA: hypothetical protein VM140_05525 [Burkholderiales bacterium]|nr:hypothetical protein [Burkholderiales bacterium]